MRFGQPPHLLFIGKPRGSVPHETPKMPMLYVIHKGKMGRQVEHQMVEGIPMGAPKAINKNGCPLGVDPPPSYPPSHPLDLLSKAPKGGFPKSIPKSTFTIHDSFFSFRSNRKYLCGLRTFPVPTKIIFNAFQNNSRIVVFICEKHLKRFRQLRNILVFIPENFRKFTE